MLHRDEDEISCFGYLVTRIVVALSITSVTGFTKGRYSEEGEVFLSSFPLKCQYMLLKVYSLVLMCGYRRQSDSLRVASLLISSLRNDHI